MRSLAKYLDRVMSFFTFLFTVAFVVTVVIQIFSRTFLPKTPSWTEELARYFFIYAVAAAAGLAARSYSFVAVDILTSKVPRKFKRAYYVGFNLFMCAFAAFFEFMCVFKFAFLKSRMVSTALEMPMQYVYFSLVILFGMLIVSYIINAYLLLTGDPIPEVEPQ